MLKALVPAAFLLVAATPAGATCTQPDIAGTWTAYSIGKDTFSGQLEWVVCNLVINKAGGFARTTSSCKAANTTVQAHGILTLSTPAKCAFSGTITVANGSQTDQIPSLTLSPDKQTAIGVGGQDGTADVFVFSMVRTQ